MLKKFIGCLICVLCTNAFAQTLAPVTGFAKSFLMSAPISNATIQILETGQIVKTDAQGKFGPIMYPVGKPITLEFKKWGYKTTQSGTFVVPPQGFTGPYNNISFQIPSLETFYLLQAVIGARLDKDSCHVVTTVTKFHKTLDDCPQGEPGAKIAIIPEVNQRPFYFGIFDYVSGPLHCKTNPFSKALTLTSEDGGAGFMNIKPRKEPYTITAYKDGVTFTKAQFICRKGAFINISPPGGPMVMK